MQEFDDKGGSSADGTPPGAFNLSKPPDHVYPRPDPNLPVHEQARAYLRATDPSPESTPPPSLPPIFHEPIPEESLPIEASSSRFWRVFRYTVLAVFLLGLSYKVFTLANKGDQAGVPGASGLQGSKGEQGAVGEAGLIGPTGETGPGGPQGVPGRSGATGATGPQGSQGPSGTASCPNGNCLSLQSTSPGATETGNINISGTLIASALQGDGSALSALNAANITTGTLADARLSSAVTLQGNTFNGANQLVQLSSSSELPAVSGANLTNLNASSISSGTLADARLSSNVPLKNSTNNFSAVNTFSAAGTALVVSNNAAINGNLDVAGTLFVGTADAFTVAANGNVTSGTVNGQTISSAANLTGTLVVATSITNPLYTSTGVLNIRPGTNSQSAIQLQNSTGLTTILSVDTTNGRIGIGNSTASTTLHVTGNARITGLVSCDTIDTDASGNLVCGSDATAGAGSATLQQAYEAGNTISVTAAEGPLAFTLTSDVLTVSTPTNATTFTTISRADGAGTNDPSQLLLLDNLDTDRAQPVGLKIQSAAGGITTALDLGDAEIVTALALGSNDVTVGGLTISSAELGLLDGRDTALVDVNDAVNTAITGTGALNVGSITSGFGSIDIGADTITSGAITISDTTDITTGTDQSLTLQANGTGEIVLNDTVQVVTLGGTSGATSLCRNVSNQIAGCSSNPDSVTLQQAYNVGQAIDVTSSALAFTLTSAGHIITTPTGGTNFTTIARADGVGAADPSQLLLIKNNDTNRALPIGLAIQGVAGGLITTAIDLSDANITNAINIGAHNIVTGATTISSTELDLLDGHDAALVDVNDAVNTAITGTGALNSGSITSGFGAIDVGTDSITTSGTIQGGTINAVTALQTGNTTRIDSAGNLSNIGTINSSGTATIGGNIVPGADDTYDLGTSSTRWRDLYLGPSSLHINSLAGETGTARDYKFGIQEAVGSSRGNLRLLEGATEILNITAGGNLGLGDTSPAATLTVGSGDLFQVAGATGNIQTSGDLQVNGGDFTTTGTAFRFDIADTGTFLFRDGTNTLLSIVDSGTMGNVTVSGNLAVNGGNLTTTASTFNVDVANAGSIVFRDGSNSLLTIADGGTVGNVTASGSITATGDLAVNGGNLTTSQTTFNLLNATATTINFGGAATAILFGSSSSSSVTTLQGKALFTHAPATAHTGSWPNFSNTSDASILINPTTAIADGNLLVAQVNGTAKFVVDAEGDVFANNIFSSGTITQSTSTITGNLTVEGNTQLGDASSDTLTVNARLASDLIPDAAPTVASASKTTTTIASTGNVGATTAIAIGTDSLPVVAYYDQTNGDLKFIHCTNTSCSTSDSVQTPDSTGATGWAPSIAVPSDGKPVISYYSVDGSDGSFKVLKCANAGCTSVTSTTVIESTVGSGGSDFEKTTIKIGIDGLPIASYYVLPEGDLKTAHCDNANCTSSTINILESTTNDVGRWNSLAIGADGYPIVSYYNNTVTGLRLKAAKCTTVNCSATTVSDVDTNASVGKYTSITIAPDNLPVISYFDGTNNDLKVAKCVNVFCSGTSTLTALDTVGTVGTYTTIAIAKDGLPIVSYLDATNGDLKVAKCGNASCTTGGITTPVVTTNNVGESAAMAIGADGLPIIAYCDGGAGLCLNFDVGDVAVVKCGDYSCKNSTGNNFIGGRSLGSTSNYFNNIFSAQLWGKQFQIANFDVAEEYRALDPSISAGEVVKLSDAGGLTIDRATSADKNVLGVISTAPAITLGDWPDKDRTGLKPVALKGRIPTFVNDQNGPIAVGDRLTPSATPGAAMKWTGQGVIIGMALDHHASGTGKVTMFANLDNLTELDIQGDDELRAFDNLNITNLATIKDLKVTGTLTVQNIVVLGHIVGNEDTRGTMTVKLGESSATYTFASPYETPPVVVCSPVNGFANFRVETTPAGFTIYLKEPALEDVKFNYLVQG